ncbi:APC family permease [Allostreptomyces psammosilenae]|uniref:Amino acid transporter n=1 Tax=Allostreptomyces psammosilenae TaxID=1892865 RepID=A0A853A401_9ACTN|nr:APC family permease [Allostreptomyces psammosilenae]NYI05208.1 amino acid transporter [Allostreptomyces psammosilenae]
MSQTHLRSERPEPHRAGAAAPTRRATAPGAHPGPTPTAAPPLRRSIGVAGGTLLTLSCVTPASSLFVIVPGLFTDLGTGTALAVLVAAVIGVGVALCYCSLASAVPSAGGEYAMVHSVTGRLTGWLMFVLSLILVMIIPPIIALGTADYLAPILDVDAQLAGAVVMLAAMLAGLLDLRANAWITGVFLVLEVAAAAVVAVLGFRNAEQSPDVLVRPVISDGAGLEQALTAGAMVAGLAVALFVLQGFTTAVYLSEEMVRPRRTVPRTVLWTLGISAAIILLPVVAITLAAPDAGALVDADLSAMVQAWSNSAVGTFVSLCVALAIINACIVMVIQNSRVLYASARDAAWPAPVNRAMTMLNRLGSPWLATLAVGLPGAVLCFVPVETLSGVTGVAVALLYFGVAAACVVSWRRARTAAAAPSAATPDPDRVRVPGGPLIPVVLLVILGYVMAVQAPLDLLITAGILLAAAGYHQFYLRRHPDTRWLVTVPEEER